MAPAPQHPPRLHHSLSLRLLLLVMATVLAIDLVYFVLALQYEWRGWMRQRLADAQLVVLAAGPAPLPSNWPALRALSQAETIRVLSSGPPRIVLGANLPPVPADMIDLDRTGWLDGLGMALSNVRTRRGATIGLRGTAADQMRLDLVIPQAPLAAFVDKVALSFLAISLTIASLLGGLLFVAVRAILVAPLLRISRNIAAFRADPERALPLDEARTGLLADEEITLVGRELSVMQAELRTALWRNARLAAVGTAMAKMSHDLRGILSSALLVADRLTMSRDEPTRLAGEVIVRSVHRATSLAQHTLDFVHQGPPPVLRSLVNVHVLVNEAGVAVLGEAARACTIHNEIDVGLSVSLDREGLLRVLTNLLRNAAQAGARAITVSAEGDSPAASVLSVADDGPGLPVAVRETLFRPFSPSGSGGSGLGLAIARDLMWAHGGDLRLASTGPDGTCFALYLQQPKRDEE